MTLENCLETAIIANEIKRDDAARLLRDYDRLVNAHKTGGHATANAAAQRDLVELLQASNSHKRRKVKLGMKVLKRVYEDLIYHKNAKGERDVGEAGLDMLEHFGTSSFSSVAGRQSAIVGMANGKMEEMLFHFRRSAVAGDLKRNNAPDLNDVVAELFGKDTGNAKAKELAKSWSETSEWLRQRFNAAGGAIGKIENWGLPQHHDARALRDRGMDAWREDIRERLDVTKMRHPLSGKVIAPDELDDVLNDVWKSVATDGWIDRDPSRVGAGRGALANQHAEHRFLVFKDEKHWLEYQDQYGGGDPFSAMMGHLNVMARDIAALEILGPNPQGTINFIKEMIEKEATMKAAGQSARFSGKPTNAINRATKINRRIDNVWGSIRGDLETPVDAKWANTLSASRSVITAGVLGSAAISSISDAGTSMLARGFNGISVAGALPEIVGAFKQGTKREAVAAGLIHDNAMQTFHKQSRYAGTLQGPQWAQYIADRVLTYSGLTPWTQAARHAFGLATQHEASKLVGKSFKDLPPLFRGMFERHGITSENWDLIRKAKLYKGDSGVTMLRPAEIASQIDPRLAERWLEVIHTETEFAVPSGSHRSRTILTSGTQPGTVMGEISRSFMQFKSFGTVFALLHGQRIHNQIASGNSKGAAAYAGSLLISTTLFGGMAVQLKQMAAGRDPRDMTTKEFGLAALLQGGGLGLYGDFFFADVNRYGGGLANTIAGPTIGKVNEFKNLTIGNIAQLASGEKTHFGRELVKFSRGLVPGGNIWYLKLAWERTVLDQVQYLVDPEANKAFKRKQKYWGREYNQEYFWAPGQSGPDRAPNVAAALQ